MKLRNALASICLTCGPIAGYFLAKAWIKFVKYISSVNFVDFKGISDTLLCGMAIGGFCGFIMYKLLKDEQ